jgi:hypothetical protein
MGSVFARRLLRSKHLSASRERWCTALLGWPGLAIGFAWGVAEAIFFFVVADVFISFVTLLSIRRGFLQIGTALVGAALGGLFLYGLAQRHPDTAHALLAKVPWIRNGMIEDARHDLQEEGAWGVACGPEKALPNKVYAVLAPEFVSPLDYVLVTVVARVTRFFGAWVIFTGVRALLRRRIDAHPRHSLAILAVFWVVFYFTVVRSAVDAFGP